MSSQQIRTGHRAGRSKPWEVAWREPSGRRRSRFFATREQRDTFAKELRKQVSQVGVGLLDVPPDEMQAFLRFRQAVGGSSAGVVEALDRAATTLLRAPSRALGEVVDAFLENRRFAGVESDYLAHVELAYRRFCEHFGAQMRLDEIGAEQIQQWLSSLPFCAETRLNYRKHLHALFEFAVQRRWVESNTIRFVARPIVVRPEPIIYTVEETERLLIVAQDRDPELLVPLALGFFAGMRTSLITRVQNPHVRLDERLIRIPASEMKGKRPLILDGLPKNLWDWLELAPATGFELSERAFLGRRAALLLRADIPSKRNGMRHSFASYHVAWLGDVGKTAKILGHRGSLSMLETHYRAQATQRDGERYFGIAPHGYSA